jgi:hypothetical protein
MKQLMNVVVLPTVAAVLMTACGNVPTSERAVKEDSVPAVTAGKAPSVAIRLKDDGLNAVYQQYMQLTAALVKGDAKEARYAGNAIEAGAKDLEGGGSLAVNAAKITATADIEAQRAAFAVLSSELIGLVKKSGLQEGQLYVDFCPMAMADKGAYWLSGEKAVQNPYFGDAMLTCGEVKETIQ